MNIVFLGTPKFAESVLQGLIDSRHNVIAVVTQEDKKVGRKQVITFPPVKELALKHNIPVYQFPKIRRDGVEILKSLNADVFITAAYGQIISQEILDIPKFCTLNVHGSLLPKYRGASPVQWCLIKGETETGITIMRTDAGIDTGDMILKGSVKIDSEDNSETLFDKLSKIATPLLLEVLDQIEKGTVKYIPQGEDFTYFPMLKKEDGKIDFNLKSEEIVNLVRGLYMWPNAYFNYEDKIVKVFKAESVSFEDKNYKCGEIVCASKQGLIVKCKDSFLKILELQAENSKRMDYKSFLNGNKWEIGTILK